MLKLKVKKNDKVVIIAGRDKGKKGVVLNVFPKESRVLVSGINIVSKHVKPSVAHGSGGVVRKESLIHVSNVMHDDPKLGIPARVGYKVLEDGRKVRYSKRSGEIIDIAN